MGRNERVRTRQTKWRSPWVQPSRRNTSDNLIWVPTVPSWEKEFCYKIGSFKWEDFLEAKKLTSYSHKVLDWDDLEAEEAFQRAKNMFYAEINNLPAPHNVSLPSPDLYIDEIDWDDDRQGINPELIDGLEGGSVSDEEDAFVTTNVNDHVPDYHHIKIEDIKPT